MADLHFGIIGFGFMGQTHGEMICRDLDYAELVAVCDIDPGQLEQAPEGVATFSDADDLLAVEAVDTVIVAVPNHLHLQMVLKACAAGKDVICEKPAALSCEEFQQMVDAASAAGVRFTVHHQRRWDEDYNIARAVLESGKVGEAYTVKSSLYGFNGNMHDWHVYPEYGGGMLYDWGVHLIDQMLCLMRPHKLQTVYAELRNVINRDVDDYFDIQMHFDNGVNCRVELGTYYLSDKPGWFERHWVVAGNGGTAYVDGFEPTGKIVHTTELLTNVPGKITMTKAGPTRSFGPPPAGRIATEDLPRVDVSHRMYFDAYRDYVLGRGELAVKPEQVMELLRVVEAVRLSGKTHRSVDFQELCRA